uniref:Uncharacterized protein n=1 Tax=Anguilla anguilla TaxID=7936 RepID=A0A0E9V8P1_ANGAN
MLFVQDGNYGSQVPQFPRSLATQLPVLNLK